MLPWNAEDLIVFVAAVPANDHSGPSTGTGTELPIPNPKSPVFTPSHLQAVKAIQSVSTQHDGEAQHSEELTRVIALTPKVHCSDESRRQHT